MNSVHVTYSGNGEEMEAESVPRRMRDAVESRRYNWKISYSRIASGQQNIILQKQSSVLYCVSIFMRSLYSVEHHEFC